MRSLTTTRYCVPPWSLPAVSSSRPRGDGFVAAFGRAGKGVEAAIVAQQDLASSKWSTGAELRVRMALHTGEVQERDGDYFGPALNRAARLMAAAHGGQIVCSRTTADLIRDALADEVALVDLGEHRLRDLTRSESVFQIDHPGLIREFPALRSVDTLPGNLPVQPNRFVGRAALIKRVSDLVAESAVVTLTGPGGVGKTRLALQVAAVLQPDRADGAWLVDLAPVNDPDRVPAVMLETLGYTLAAGEEDVVGLCARLRRRRLLLVVDNCEHLVARVATVVDAISTSAPDVRVLVTSREGLDVPAEHVLPVTPLATEAGGEAVELFVTRARAVRPDFAFDADLEPTVVELCRRLDGIPLAIELAAARTRSIAPAQVLRRLDERFRLLTGGSRTAMARHQTLQAAVDWSYELLADPERAVLDRLSVFAGGFTLHAAEAVAGDDEIDSLDVFEHVSALVDKSLVVADPGEETRYRLLETIRQYAADRLARSGTTAEARARHAHHYRAVAAAIGPELSGSHDLVNFDRLSTDLDNLRLMLEWYRDHNQVEVVVDVIWELDPFWFGHDLRLEMSSRLEATIDPLGEDHLRLSRVHGLLTWTKANLGYAGVPEHAEHAAQQAELAGSPVPVQSLYGLAAFFMTYDGDTERAIEQCQLGITAARAIGNLYLAAWGRTMVVLFSALRAPGADETIRLADQVQHDIEQTGSGVLRVLWLSARAFAVIPVDPDRALALLDEEVALATSANLSTAIAEAEFFRGVVFFMQRRYGEAAATWRRALVGHHDIGNRRGVLIVLSAVTGLTERTERSGTALVLLENLRAARVLYGVPGSAIEQKAERTIEERVARSLARDIALDQVPRLDVEAVIDLALDALDDIAGEIRR